MVDVAVQTEASFIMEMKAYLMQKQVGNGSENAVKQRNVFNQANSLKSIRENNHVTFSQFDEKVFLFYF